MFGPARTRLKHMLRDRHPTKKWTAVSSPYHSAMGELPAPVRKVLPTPAAVLESPPVVPVAVEQCPPPHGPAYPDQEADPALEEFADPGAGTTRRAT